MTRGTTTSRSMRSALPLNHPFSSSVALYLGLPLENGKLELALRRNAGAPISTSLVLRILPPNTLSAFALGGKVLLPERKKNSSRPLAVPSHSPPRESQTKQSEKTKNSRKRSSRSPIWRRFAEWEWEIWGCALEDDCLCLEGAVYCLSSQEAGEWSGTHSW